MRIYLTCFIMLVLTSSFAYAENTDIWKDQILYFVLLDRFYDGNKENCQIFDHKCS